ncbi:P-loop containing nucleoside triphosphate hydrolase protein [Mycena latifolia]|nr:P-loop containing nucleoside triphosphate hydrolase protein [Mycena latifolia]
MPVELPQPSNNCPPPTRIFHGRQTILHDMQEYFNQNVGKQRIFLLYGLGGAGKTQIALKFIQDSASHFTDIFLIDTSTVETIDAGLKTIATTKSVGESSKDALQWLKSKKDEWLLLFDNADDPKINLNNFFPQCNHGNILITSRNPGLCIYAGAHCMVSDMEAVDAIELLLRSAAQDTTDDSTGTAAQIVKVLHYLPLAIIQAGAFIAKSGNLASYLGLYAHNRARLLAERPAQSHDNYAWTVYTTWQISFDQLSEPAKTFLKLCSSLHYQGISEAIFRNATKYKPEPSGPSTEELEMPLRILPHLFGPSGVWDPFRFMDVANELRAYSLINFDSGQNSLSIHPLVHEWTRSTLSDQAHHSCMTAIAGMSLTGLSAEDMRLPSLWMLPHIDFLMWGNFNASPDFRYEFAKVYLFTGKLEKAEELQVGLLEKQRNILGANHPNTLKAMYWLAWTYVDLGKWKEAEGLLTVVLTKRRDALGYDHPDTVEAIVNLATVYNHLGKFKEAEEMLVKIPKVSQDLGSMEVLAITYERLGKYKEAEELALIVLEKQTNIAGDNHPDTLNTMANVANIYFRLGKLREAAELQAMVLEKHRHILGDNHFHTLRTMGNLANTYRTFGKLQEAEMLECIVLEKRRSVLGDNHPDTLIAQGNLGATYHKLGRLQEAEDLEAGVLKKRKAVLGESHPDTLRTMSNLGSTLNKLGKWQEAEELLVEALRKQNEVLGDDHPHIADTMQNLAVTYTKLGKLNEVEDLELALDKYQG